MAMWRGFMFVAFIIDVFTRMIVGRRASNSLRSDLAEAVEFATLKWLDWFKNRRLLEPFGNIPFVELEMADYQTQQAPAGKAGLR